MHASGVSWLTLFASGQSLRCLQRGVDDPNRTTRRSGLGESRKVLLLLIEGKRPSIALLVALHQELGLVRVYRDDRRCAFRAADGFAYEIDSQKRRRDHVIGPAFRAFFTGHAIRCIDCRADQVLRAIEITRERRSNGLNTNPVMMVASSKRSILSHPAPKRGGLANPMVSAYL